MSGYGCDSETEPVSPRHVIRSSNQQGTYVKKVYFKTTVANSYRSKFAFVKKGYAKTDWKDGQ